MGVETQPAAHGSCHQSLHPTAHSSAPSLRARSTYHLEHTGASPLRAGLEQGGRGPAEVRGWEVRRLLTQPEKECPEAEGTDPRAGGAVGGCCACSRMTRERNKTSRSGKAPGSSRAWKDRPLASEESGEAPVALQVAPARTPALALSDQNKHEAIKMSAHALPAEHGLRLGVGLGAPRGWQEGCRAREERPSVLLQR